MYIYMYINMYITCIYIFSLKILMVVPNSLPVLYVDLDIQLSYIQKRAGPRSAVGRVLDL